MPIDDGLLFTLSIVLIICAVVLAMGIVGQKWWARRAERRDRAVLARLEAEYRTGGPQFEALAAQHRDLAHHLLLERLKEGDSTAAAHLERLGFVAAYDEGVKNPSPEVRASTAHNLGLLPADLHPERLLLPLLQDPHPVVREAAVRAISTTGSGDAVGPILGSLASSPDPYLYRMARHTLTECGPHNLPALLEAATGGKPQVRRLALDVLAELNAPAVLAPLLELTTDPDLEIRLRAARAIRFYDSPEARAALLRLSEDPEWQVRAQAAKALSWVGHEAVVERLKALCCDRSYWVRNNAAQSLRFKGQAGRQALEDLAAGDDAYAAERARESLETMRREASRA